MNTRNESMKKNLPFLVVVLLAVPFAIQADINIKTKSHTDSYYYGGVVRPSVDAQADIWIGKDRLVYISERHKLIVSVATSGESKYELYDLDEDPLEERNVYDDAAYGTRREELKDLLVARIMETSTPPYSSWLSELPSAVK